MPSMRRDVLAGGSRDVSAGATGKGDLGPGLARSGPRMSLAVNRDQPVNGDVRVDLRRGQRSMPEYLLDAAQVSATFQQMRRGGVPQPVRSGIGYRTSRGDPGVNDPADRARINAAATGSQEHGRRPAPSQHRTAVRKPFPDRAQRRDADRDGSLLVALSEDPDRAPAGIEVVHVQSA